jgi:3-methyl-2-oxobutanoate hydroxymethyltransferase
MLARSSKPARRCWYSKPSRRRSPAGHRALAIPTIGIGAGKDCSGQVLVLHDMLDIYPGRKARFVKNFMAGASGVQDAIRRYVEAVKSGAFPAPEHTF